MGATKWIKVAKDLENGAESKGGENVRGKSMRGESMCDKSMCDVKCWQKVI